MKKLFLVLSITFLIITQFSAQSTTPTWQYTISATQWGDEMISKPHPSGVFIAAEIDFEIVCYLVSSNGNLLWTDTYDHGQAERIVDVDVDASTGNIYVLINTEGLNSVNLGQDYILLKYSQNGVLLSSRVHNHIDSGYSNEREETVDMLIDANGDILVLYMHYHGSCLTADKKIVVDKFDPSLNLIWTYSSPFSTWKPKSICFSSTGKLVVSYYFNGIPKFGYINPVNGTLLSETSYAVPVNVGTGSYKLVPDNFGNIIGFGDDYWDTSMGGIKNPAVLKIDDTGQILWALSLGVGEPNDMVVDDNGNVYVSFDEWGITTKAKLAKLNSSGVEEWRNTIDVAGVNTQARDLEIAPNNDVFFATSQEIPSANTDSYLRKFDSSGNLLWMSQPYNIQTQTIPKGRISLGLNGDVYLTGEAGTSLFTISYTGIALGVTDNAIAKKVTIYPNPATEQLYIGGDVNISYAQIIDMTGRVIKAFAEVPNTISVVDLPKGIYFLKLITEHGPITKKFIKL